ncbi:hypothetical protein PAXRUDRAFT_140980 [Paxillus rubicundulus Ve08.2h10]|uniref:Uncharacterized protein n=1 Tax=Paxillus rubicundulus Ve08.2h10 TaxID=930991 RepID=A0A0D0DDE3_9AGAM|nr:hypothetical protein PAXRUDRAFT_140980 [Paxillus rubicundulus Ve08.2h10]
MYKKNGSKGSRHESISLVSSREVLSLSNIGLRVFTQTHPEERENSFWHSSKSTGDLWTLASTKEIVYNLGPLTLDAADGRYYQLKPWAFDRWVFV